MSQATKPVVPLGPKDSTRLNSCLFGPTRDLQAKPSMDCRPWGGHLAWIDLESLVLGWTIAPTSPLLT
jgi:hypothetical protein